mmetsp:Transcript_1833/g.1887  ORF Transcript_1833/g.1887 Transcript_1833/m.1887 type:complete len:178 (-) Transcript_1833:320-853(-)|eukprot:CAMPEP_0205800528 /NCGR_PEP_ID=MMETSP0205-20121125/2200_1 /ASSEMBLY_ACC=CAM_ASM_000278 /TAXON_ID=36767 /ORGANISM="Euplotes focardii, Strain TN1" /LENGTH=177 /DNA_ID=CAMNT_0053063733 /DNA_START=78 /DNA_END=611 /DNA_ORIENTATION=-
MKPDWDKLAEDYADSSDTIIVDVDCTQDASKDLCSKYGVRGYPTIKYFTASTDPLGDKYEKGRTYDDMKAFAEENLGASCGPSNMDLCSEEKRAEIQGFLDMDEADLQTQVDEKTAAIDGAETTFKDAVSALQKSYEELMAAKDETVKKASENLGIMRGALNAKKSPPADEVAKDEL